MKKIIDNLTSSQLKTYQIVHFRFGHVVSIIKFFSKKTTNRSDLTEFISQ